MLISQFTSEIDQTVQRGQSRRSRSGCSFAVNVSKNILFFIEPLFTLGSINIWPILEIAVPYNAG